MNRQDSQDLFRKDYTPTGVAIPKPLTKGLPENKHGIDNKVIDLKTGADEVGDLPDHTYLGNTSGLPGPASPQDLGINTTFRTLDGKRVTVVNGLVTIATSTSTSSSSSSSSSISTSSSSSSSSSVSTSSSSSS